MTEFAAAVDRLINQVRHWELPRWRGGRSERVFGLVQLLADLAADAESRPRRPVPREGEIVLPDQLRVVADDLLAAGPAASVLAEAAAAVDSVRRGI